MPPLDHAAVIAALEANLYQIERLAIRMSPEALTLRPAPDAWSPLEVIEHLAVVERGVHRQVTNAAALPPSEVRTEEKDAFVDGAATVVTRLKAPEVVVPSSRFGNKAFTIFRDRRVSTINLALSLDVDWRAHHAEHPLLGLLDVGQWFLLAARHGERHARQIAHAK
jgi:DinB superfamily